MRKKIVNNWKIREKSCTQKLINESDLQEMKKGFLVKTMDKNFIFNYYH